MAFRQRFIDSRCPRQVQVLPIDKSRLGAQQTYRAVVGEARAVTLSSRCRRFLRDFPTVFIGFFYGFSTNFIANRRFSMFSAPSAAVRIQMPSRDCVRVKFVQCKAESAPGTKLENHSKALLKSARLARKVAKWRAKQHKTWGKRCAEHGFSDRFLGLFLVPFPIGPCLDAIAGLDGEPSERRGLGRGLGRHRRGAL